MNNFNTLMAIVGGIELWSVSRWSEPLATCIEAYHAKASATAISLPPSCSLQRANRATFLQNRATTRRL
jgi:hypothetical protein